MLQELVGFCRQTVTVARRTGIDGFGEATYGTPQAYRVRISGMRRLITNSAGDEVLANQRIYFATSPQIGPHDQVTLSTSDAGSTESGAIQPGIAAVTRVLDDLGRPHVVVDLDPRTA